jgi:hypothetical protein
MRTVEGLWSTIGELLPAFKPPECTTTSQLPVMM